MKRFIKIISTVGLILGGTSMVAWADSSISPSTTIDRQKTNGFLNNPHPEKTAQEMGITVYQPPTGFDPMTAKNADLEEYGFPQRPTNPSDLASWKKAMAAAKTFITPKFKDTDTRACSFSQTYSSNWSGYADYTSNCTEVQGTFAVPNLISTAINQPDGAQVVVWDGIGGWSTNRLIQAGVDATYHDVNTSSGNQQWATYNVWWEALPDYPSMQSLSLAVNPGDTLYVSCTYNPSTGVTSFYIEDQTDGQVASFGKSTSGDYDGSVAEWIAERPAVYPRNNLYPFTFLANFGSETFSGATEVEGGVDYAIGNAPRGNTGPVLMDDSSCTIIANASSQQYTGPSSFVDYWHNYGNEQ